jgi:hypothetical protein
MICKREQRRQRQPHNQPPPAFMVKQADCILKFASRAMAGTQGKRNT